MKVILFAVQSLDGWITAGDRPGDDFASRADQGQFLAEFRRCDACVMGRATYDQVRARLRLAGRPELRRVVWTRTPDAYQAEAVPGRLEFSADTPEALTARLRADGRMRCALLGGGATNAAWLRAGLVDELHLTLEPVLFGRGTPLADELTAETAGRRWRLLECRALGESSAVALRYALER